MHFSFMLYLCQNMTENVNRSSCTRVSFFIFRLNKGLKSSKSCPRVARLHRPLTKEIQRKSPVPYVSGRMDKVTEAIINVDLGCVRSLMRENACVQSHLSFELMQEKHLYSFTLPLKMFLKQFPFSKISMALSRPNWPILANSGMRNFNSTQLLSTSSYRPSMMEIE